MKDYYEHTSKYFSGDGANHRAIRQRLFLS